MLDISKILIESMKRQFPNKEAYLIVLRELKTKESLMIKEGNVKSVENQFKLLNKMKKDRTDSKECYEKNGRSDLANKENNELTAINQLLKIIEAELPPPITMDDVESLLIAGKSKGWKIKEAMQFFKENYPTVNRSEIAKIANQILK